MGAARQQAFEQDELLAEQPALVRIHKPVARYLAPRKMNLEATIEGQAIEIVVERLAAPSPPPPPRQQMSNVQRHRHVGLVGDGAEEVVGVDGPGDDARTRSARIRMI